MTLTFGAILHDAGIELAGAHVIRHAYVREHEDSGLPGIHADSTDAEILTYTSQQSARPRIFPSAPPRLWIVFIRDDGDRFSLLRVFDPATPTHQIDAAEATSSWRWTAAGTA